MKLVLITTSFLMIGSNAYNKVGVEKYCNIDPDEFTAQCNYESRDNCQSYLQPGQRCMVNTEYRGGASSTNESVPEIQPAVERQLLAAWQANKSRRSPWSERVDHMGRQIHQEFQRRWAILKKLFGV